MEKDVRNGGHFLVENDGERTRKHPLRDESFGVVIREFPSKAGHEDVEVAWMRWKKVEASWM